MVCTGPNARLPSCSVCSLLPLLLGFFVPVLLQPLLGVRCGAGVSVWGGLLVSWMLAQPMEDGGTPLQGRLLQAVARSDP